jgi:hypothetical protein
MTKTRIIVLLAAGSWLGLVSASPAIADGLAKFEKSIKSQVPPGVMTYKSSKALGDNGFELDGVVITPPPSDPKTEKPQPISIKTITVESLDFDAIDKQQPPLFAKLKIVGVASGSNPGGMFDLKQIAGLDTVSADLALDYKLDTAKKMFSLNQLELNLTGLAKLDTAAVLDGVSPDAAEKPDAAMNDASLESANLIYEDHSLLAKALPIAAAMQGIDPKAAVAMAIALLDNARAGQGEAAQKAIDSLVAFVEDYQKPKGPLKIALNPPDKVTDAAFNDAKDADAMVKLLGIEVTYAGTRASTPAEIPAATDTPADKDEPLEKKKE